MPKVLSITSLQYLRKEMLDYCDFLYLNRPLKALYNTLDFVECCQEIPTIPKVSKNNKSPLSQAWEFKLSHFFCLQMHHHTSESEPQF